MSKNSIEINAGSMADIAFLMLIFFLVTTTMNIDSGILRILPPMPEGKIPPVNERNVMKILLNRNDKLMIEDQSCNMKLLKKLTKDFIMNPSNDKNLSEAKMKTIPGLGEILVSKGIISLKNDRGTSYNMYIRVQNEIAATFHEMRNEFSIIRFGIKFDLLKDKNKIKAIQTAIPLAISEAEPENTGGN